MLFSFRWVSTYFKRSCFCSHRFEKRSRKKSFRFEKLERKRNNTFFVLFLFLGKAKIIERLQKRGDLARSGTLFGCESGIYQL
ncbi:hypothetical protein DWV63_00150 [Enterococcus durans]|nr:hypothetical protein DWV63_00150 [Enterococcus durans]